MTEASISKSLNSTAYRIYRILEWLVEKPLTLTEINLKFKADPLIGKVVSSDSILLYMNTLKAIGCEIQRPSPKNSFHYMLLYHPFGMTLTGQHIQLLIKVKSYVQTMLGHTEMLNLDCFLKKLLNFSTIKQKDSLQSELFEKSRSLDYGKFPHHIAMLENCCKSGETLLIMAYESPLKGREVFHFLPELLFYEQGVLYIRGEREEFDLTSNLRVDRIADLKVVKQVKLLRTLQDRKKELTQVEIQLFCLKKENHSHTALRAEHGVYHESSEWINTADEGYYHINLAVRDFFYLKQFLLSTPYVYKIVRPTFFLADLQMSLETVKAYYEKSSESC
jgi:hypothetical protein